jgi:DNA adenine methylase
MRNKHLQLKYPGGKSHVAEEILPFAPTDFTEFRDPFCGNCPWVFYTDWIAPSMPRWLNDLDEHVNAHVNWLKGKDRLEDFWELRGSLIDSAEKSKAFFYDACEIVRCRTSPHHYFVLRRLAHRQIVRPRNRKTVASFGHHLLKNSMRNLYLDDLYEARQTLSGVRMTSMDALDVIRAPTDGIVFAMIDPPYNIEDHNSGLYDYEYDPDDQVRLRDVLASLNPQTHKFVLTIDRTPLCHDLYELSKYARNKLFHCYPRAVTYGMSNNRERTRKTELVVTNFKEH